MDSRGRDLPSIFIFAHHVYLAGLDSAITNETNPNERERWSRTSTAFRFVCSMRSEVLVEEVGFDDLTERRVIRNPLVQVEVQVNDFLDDLLDLVIERNPHVL